LRYSPVWNHESEGLSALWSGQYDSGITYRFEIWQKALALFLEAPITGVGSQQYAQAVLSGIDSGELSRGLKRCCLDHAHNDLIQILATRGLIGALSWLLLLAIPFVQFLRLIRHDSPGLPTSPRPAPWCHWPT